MSVFVQFYVKLTKFDTGKFFCNIIHFPPVAESIFDSILISWAPITGHSSPGGRKITTETKSLAKGIIKNAEGVWLILMLLFHTGMIMGMDVLQMSVISKYL